MLPVTYDEVVLFACNKKEFDGNDGHVEYNECIFLLENDDETRSVVLFNSSQDLADSLDKTGTLKVEVDPSGKRKPRLISFDVE